MRFSKKLRKLTEYSEVNGWKKYAFIRIASSSEIRESEFVMVVKSGNAIMKLNTDTLKKFNRT